MEKKLGLISSLTLVNAVSNQDIRELKNGDTINLRQDGNKLSVRANISGSVGSVNFDLDGVIKIDNSAHYVYPANVGSDYFSFTPTLGVHLLTVKPFSKARGRGDEGATFSIGFKVISGVVSPATSNTNIPATVANPKPLPLPATSPSPTSIDVMSLATLSPCKSDTCTVSGPVRVTKSGTVIKNLKISNPQGACLIIAAENVRIENSEIGPCLTQGILVQASGATIIRNYIHDTFREGIYTFNTSGLMVQNNRFETISAGVRAVVGQRVVIDRNFIKNVMGTSGTGNIVQFDKVHGAGNRVTCNIGFNEIGRSKSEDLINIYGSVGTAQDPIQIIGNKLKGGGPSLSGGGILLGDAGGAYAIAKDNILVDPGQYGIGIVGGHHQTLTNNIVYGKSQSFTNVGIQVWDFYKIGNCSSNIVSYNLINFINASNHQNDFWTNDSCKPISGVDTNIWKARIDETVFESDIEFCR